MSVYDMMVDKFSVKSFLMHANFFFTTKWGAVYYYAVDGNGEATSRYVNVPRVVISNNW